jgi:hypothetical protein
MDAVTIERWLQRRHHHQARGGALRLQPGRDKRHELGQGGSDGQDNDHRIQKWAEATPEKEGTRGLWNAQTITSSVHIAARKERGCDLQLDQQTRRLVAAPRLRRIEAEGKEDAGEQTMNSCFTTIIPPVF